ncbi:alpha/beta fold hydrolase [Rothia halotolerans]|uniref:alpha/beta fold hydrolase n=1 Tax=Rothia halotolerans TaxID=405770 RepID=UPI00101CF42E|nr:alpha/beta fold hydrolase [Rothia halotolerans]
MPSFSVPGAVLDTELSDEGGHAVVQLHGLTSSRSRDRVMNLDLGRGLSGTRLLRYDARAHGRSTGRAVPEDYRWTVLAEDLLRLLDEWFPGERVHGVGPSMGAATLLHAAMLDPGRFSGFTLMVPPTAWGTRPARAERYRQAAAIVERRGVAGMLAAAEDVPPPPAAVPAPASAPDVAEGLLPAVYRGAALSDLPSAGELARLGTPTSLLAWAEDPAHPLSTAEALAQLLPAATLRVAYTPADVDAWPGVLKDDVAAHG